MSAAPAFATTVTRLDVEHVSREIRRLMKDNKRLGGPKKLAALAGRDCKNADTVLNAALDDANRNRTWLDDFIAYVLADEQDVALKHLASLKGLRLVKDDKRTEQEMVIDLVAAASAVVSAEIVADIQGWAHGDLALAKARLRKWLSENAAVAVEERAGVRQ